MRLIDADDLIKILELHSLSRGAVLGWHSGVVDAVIEEVERRMPTVDAVPVVRCRDCKYWDTGWKPSGHPKETHWCSMTDTFPCGDWFCADGERRDGGDT